MIIIEKFAFGFEDFESEIQIAGGVDSDTGDYSIQFCATERDPVHIKITVRGKKDFARFIEAFRALGLAMLEERTVPMRLREKRPEQ